MSNEYYDQTIEGVSSGKDSIFEIGEITKFDAKSMTASILGLRTKEVKENVIVAFPNLFLNSGLIPFPLNKTKGLLFIGSDNQNYFLPAQFHLPYMDSEKGKAKLDASPKRVDKFTNFEDFSQGEFLIRHIKGSSFMMTNDGNITAVTDKLHRLTLDSQRGELLSVFDKTKKLIGYSTFINSVIQKKDEASRHKISMTVKEVGPKWLSEKPMALKDAIELVSLEPDEYKLLELPPSPRNVLELDLINVMDEDDNPVISERIPSELFYRRKINLNDEEVHYEELTKSGSYYEKWTKDKVSKITEEDLNNKEVIHKDEKKKKTHISSVGQEKIVINSGNGYLCELDMSSDELVITVKGSSIPKIFKVSKNSIEASTGISKVEIRHGSVEMNVGSTSANISNGDIDFSVSNGRISVSEIISKLRY